MIIFEKTVLGYRSNYISGKKATETDVENCLKMARQLLTSIYPEFSPGLIHANWRVARYLLRLKDEENGIKVEWATSSDFMDRKEIARQLHKLWVADLGLANHNWDDKYDDEGKLAEDNSERRARFEWFVDAMLQILEV